MTSIYWNSAARPTITAARMHRSQDKQRPRNGITGRQSGRPCTHVKEIRVHESFQGSRNRFGRWVTIQAHGADRLKSVPTDVPTSGALDEKVRNAALAKSSGSAGEIQIWLSPEMDRLRFRLLGGAQWADFIAWCRSIDFRCARPLTVNRCSSCSPLSTIA